MMAVGMDLTIRKTLHVETIRLERAFEVSPTASRTGGHSTPTRLGRT